MENESVSTTARDTLDELALLLQEMKDGRGLDREQLVAALHLVHRTLEQVVTRDE